MRALLRIRDARVFLAGWTLSQFGDWAMIIVLAVWAKALTKSNAAAGLVFFALAAPSIFSPLAGVVVDRVRRRPLLVAVYSVEAVVVLSLLFVHDRGDVWLIYGVTVFYGTAGTLVRGGILVAGTTSDAGNARSWRISSITRPTTPVAPTTATLGRPGSFLMTPPVRLFRSGPSPEPRRDAPSGSRPPAVRRRRG